MLEVKNVEAPEVLGQVDISPPDAKWLKLKVLKVSNFYFVPYFLILNITSDSDPICVVVVCSAETQLAGGYSTDSSNQPQYHTLQTALVGAIGAQPGDSSSS